MSPPRKSKRKSKERPDTALFICRCGSNIAGVIDIDALKERYEEYDLTLVDVDDHLCAEQGLRTLTDNIKKSKAKKVVIAGCSPHLHKDLFTEAARDAGIDPGHLQIANIREQCSWVHVDNPKAALNKAAAIIDSCLALVKESNPILLRKTEVTRRALVIGGGVAGLTTALRTAEAGIETIIVEREGFLGGHMAKWDKLFPTFDCSICILGPIMTRVARHPLIRIITLADITNIEGTPGSYTVTVNQHARYVDIETCTGCNKCLEVCPVDVVDSYNYGLGKRKAIVRPSMDAVPLAPFIDMENCVGCQSCAGVCEPKSLRFDDVDKLEEIEVGAIIVATGFQPFDARLVEEYGYGENLSVITSAELERLINPEGPTGGRIISPATGEIPKQIVFVPCVGSRSQRLGRPYCSRVCCTAAVKEVVQIKQQLPDSETFVFYTDMRTFGKGYEELYERAAKDHNVRFIRGSIGDVVYDPATEKTMIRAEDTLLRRIVELDVDLVVLMIGMDPDPSNRKIADLLKVPLDENGFFLEQHPKLNPSSTFSRGVFLAGVAQGPKDIADTVAHAGLAASRVIDLLSREKVEIEACVPSFTPEPCLRCLACVKTCTSNAITYDSVIPEINLVACRACGACVAACPSGALDLPCLTNEQLTKSVKAAVASNPIRPSIVGFLCRWCAYSAADRAGTARLSYPPNLIPIEVPCTGRVGSQIILTAFAEGADGVALLGCHEQDCHYRSGAKRAKDRTENLRKIIEASGIDGRRLYFGSASASEGERFANHVIEFNRLITSIGPLGIEIPKDIGQNKPTASEAVTTNPNGESTEGE